MISREDLQSIPLLAELPPDQVDAIAARAADLNLEPGEFLLEEGEQAAFFFLLRGQITVIKTFAGVKREINILTAPIYFGEVPLLLGSPAIADLRANEACRVARLEMEDFQELFLTSRSLSDQLFSKLVERITKARGLVSEIPRTAITVVGQSWDRECHELRNFLARNRVAYTWVESDDAAATRVPGGFSPGTACPLVVLPDGSRLLKPSPRELAESIHLGTKFSIAAANGTYDVAIVGGGPAGLAAAVYGASEGLKTILFERLATGGQAGTSSRIENYLGFPAGLSGDELSTRAARQAERFGAEIVIAREAMGLAAGGSAEPGGSAHTLKLDGDDCVRARAIVLATGVSWRQHDAEGIGRMLGRGLYYGAARTEAHRTRGKHIHLLGGGNSAGQAAMWFSNYADRVTMLVRGQSLAASMSQYLIDQLAAKRNLEIRYNTELVAVDGREHVEQVTLRDRLTGESRPEPTGAVFILIGADAKTSWLPATIVRDERGYVCTGRDMLEVIEGQGGGAATWTLERDPYLLETSVPGVFAAGDVRHGSIKRCASGVGEGSMSIAFVHHYLAG